MKKVVENSKKEIEGKSTLDIYKSDRASQIDEVISGIENVGLLTADQLIAISLQTFQTR